MRYPPLVAVDLSPPPAVREGISLLLELIDTYNSMMVPASGKRPNFDPVISALLDPIIQVSFLVNCQVCLTNCHHSIILKLNCQNTFQNIATISLLGCVYGMSDHDSHIDS